MHVQSTDDAIDNTAELENATEAAVELFARFLSFAAGKLDEDAQSEAARTSILLKSLKYFTASYLTTQDIHVFVAAFDTEVRGSSDMISLTGSSHHRCRPSAPWRPSLVS